MQMILQSCFGLFFNCGKTGDKETEQERREVRTMSGKASMVIKSRCKNIFMQMSGIRGLQNSQQGKKDDPLTILF